MLSILDRIAYLPFTIIDALDELRTRIVCGYYNLDIKAENWYKARPTRYRSLVYRLAVWLP
jgi:hypothetical protein